MRANIDAWWPMIASGEVEALVMNASGCGVTVREYGHFLKDDPAYAEKAERIGLLTKDLSELLPDIVAALRQNRPDRVPGALPSRRRRSGRHLAFHPPCSLQHGRPLRGGVEQHLVRSGSGCNWRAANRTCCGSAGTYSVLNPDLSHLGHLGELQPDVIVSATSATSPICKAARRTVLDEHLR